MKAGLSQSELLDRVYQALSDPTRRAILERLGRGEYCVTELAAPLSISLNAVSKHIKSLERAKLVRRRKVGREHYLQINSQPFQAAQSWIGKQQRFWNQAMTSLSDHLEGVDTKHER